MFVPVTEDYPWTFFLIVEWQTALLQTTVCFQNETLYDVAQHSNFCLFTQIERLSSNKNTDNF